MLNETSDVAFKAYLTVSDPQDPRMVSALGTQ